jgi:glyoxylase-like metal-dependent hydrolase (beta-lactamase superfamily II)
MDLMARCRVTSAAWCGLVGLCLLAMPRPSAAQEAEIFAIRYGGVDDFPLRSLLPDAPEGEVIDISLSMWLVRIGGKVILVDTGFFREEWLDRFNVHDFVRPDVALLRMGVRAEDVTDVVITHAHWDHMGGLELFPGATVWIQEDEFIYYTGAAWQPGNNSGGIDRADVLHLVERNMAGSVRLVQGDGVEILPGITVFTGGHHTYASQYVLVGGSTPVVLASDNAYLYLNINEGRAGATFAPENREANLDAVQRMIGMAGDPVRIIPGHDPEVFLRFPRVADGVVRIQGDGSDSRRPSER